MPTKPAVPYHLLDKYYFDYFQNLLAQPLKALSTDRATLRGTNNHEQVNTFEGLYEETYLCAPAFLDDLFPVLPEEYQHILRGYAALAISYVLLDSQIDQQMPVNQPTIPLIQQHLQLDVAEHFGKLNLTEAVWELYRERIRAFFNALAMESFCLDAHQARYDFSMMREIAYGKAMLFHVTAQVMGHLSNRKNILSDLETIFTDMVMTDQIIDDGTDWRKDYGNNRYTYPILLAIESEGDQIETAHGIPLKEIEERINKHGIISRTRQESLDILKHLLAKIEHLQLQDSKLEYMVSRRVIEIERWQRSSGTVNVLDYIITKLKASI